MKQDLTPQAVLDEVIDCFYQAHCKSLGFGVGNEESAEAYCRSLVKRAFDESEGDFVKPTKESLSNALNWLSDFSENFRSPEVIKNNYERLMKRVNALS